MRFRKWTQLRSEGNPHEDEEIFQDGNSVSEMESDQARSELQKRLILGDEVREV